LLIFMPAALKLDGGGVANAGPFPFACRAASSTCRADPEDTGEGESTWLMRFVPEANIEGEVGEGEVVEREGELI
jgi:hypothetical protein